MGIGQTVGGHCVRNLETGGGPQEPTGFPIRYNGTVGYLGANGVNNGLGQDKYTKTREAGAGEGGEGAFLDDSGPYFLPDDRGAVVAVTSFGLNDACTGRHAPKGSTCRWCCGG
jgi:hypothetical protein